MLDEDPFEVTKCDLKTWAGQKQIHRSRESHSKSQIRRFSNEANPRSFGGKTTIGIRQPAVGGKGQGRKAISD